MRESKKPRGRNGGRIPLSPEEKRVLAYFYLPRWLLEAFKELIPVAADRSNLIFSWVRAYTNTGGKTDCLLGQPLLATCAKNLPFCPSCGRTDCLLVQSPLAAELLAYLEATDAPKDLCDQLELLIMQQKSDEVKIVDGVVRAKREAEIV